jgi:Zn-dependent oligopeptidase
LLIQATDPSLSLSPQTLNTNRVLFSALSATVATGDRQGGGFWGFPERETVARVLLRDFRLGGIHLEAEAHERVWR